MLFRSAGVPACSVSEYIATIDPDLDARCRAAIEKALQAIAQIPEPFAQSAKSGEAQNAVKVVGTDLVDILTEVNAALSR